MADFEPTQRLVNPPAQDQSPDPTPLPEKYHGKSASEIARMHQEAEKALGRMANEMGQLRKAQQAVQQQHHNPEPVGDTPDTSHLYEALAPLAPALQMVTKMAQREFDNELKSEFGDTAVEVSNSSEFLEWVKQSPTRTMMYQSTAANLDIEAGKQLLRDYHAMNRAQQGEGDEHMEEGTSPRGGGFGTGKIYRSIDLQRMQMRDPEGYRAFMASEGQRAYAEGRVVR